MNPPRTYLFVPGDRPERFDKALAAGADRVILDLEDAVMPAAKEDARRHVAERLQALAEVDRQRWIVRINDEATPWFDDDLAMLRATGARAAMLPKAERPASIDRVRTACAEIDVLALIETARGLLQAEALAATPGVSRLVFGTVDFALDLDLSGDPIGFDAPASRLALASRAAGLPAPVAGVTTEIADPGPLLAELARARAHGFGAKLCIHPRQVAAVHEALQPTTAQIDWARRVIAAAEGQAGAVQVDGRMVDRPVVERARLLLARAQG